MRKLFFTTSMAAILFASCSGNKENTQPAPDSNVMLPEPNPADSSTVATAELSPEEQGLNLIKGMDCLTCHTEDTKLVGPAYREVAAKYSEADLDLLAKKIIDGGQGVWGEIPMAPHAGLSEDNAKLMVKYILSLKK
ncbi:MAG: cytochrome C [Flavobacteriaceae bacterium]|jgi:cytochrome c|nr:cytochrome C [Flavobacteriaceae bacterium]